MTIMYLVILCVEIRLQMIQNSNKLKYYFNTFVLVFQYHSYYKDCEHNEDNIRHHSK
jgi:hypothetical protein